MEITPPAGFVVQSAGPNRVTLHRAGSRVICSVYTVEFGNLARWSEQEEQSLLRDCRRRVGKTGQVSIAAARLGGREARALSCRGRRNGGDWHLEAVFSVRGGQALVVEALFPETQREQGLAAHAAMLRNLVWREPERG